MSRLAHVAYIIAIFACCVATAGCKKSTGSSNPLKGKPTATIDTTVGHAPSGVRIKVEVLNASTNHGAARRATLLLRSRGYDVVSMGTTRQTQAATLILDRSHHPEWSELISKAVGGKAVERPDTSRYLDATVVLGSEWTAPPMPFHP